MNNEKPTLGQEEHVTLASDPRLAQFPYGRLGPGSGDREYGTLSVRGIENLSNRDRMQIDEGIFLARARRNQGQHQMGVWHERKQLPDGQVALFVYEAKMYGDQRRVFGDVYVVPAERADDIEAIIKEHAELMREQFIASLKNSTD